MPGAVVTTVARTVPGLVPVVTASVTVLTVLAMVAMAIIAVALIAVALIAVALIAIAMAIVMLAVTMVPQRTDRESGYHGQHNVDIMVRTGRGRRQCKRHQARTGQPSQFVNSSL